MSIGLKDSLKKQADFDTSEQNISQWAGVDENGKDVYRQVSMSTKALKQRYDDLVNSGTATEEQIKHARTEWEDAQKASITHGQTVEIRSLKSNLAGLINDNLETLESVAAFVDGKGNEHTIIDVNANSDYDTINFAAIAANNQQVNNVNDDRYRQSKRNDAAVANNKK